MHAVGDEIHAGPRVGQNGLNGADRTGAGLRLGRRIEDVVEMRGMHGAGIEGGLRLFDACAGVRQKDGDLFLPETADDGQYIGGVGAD